MDKKAETILTVYPVMGPGNHRRTEKLHSEMDMTVEWKGGMAFEAMGDNGKTFTMDAHPDHGGDDSGVSPVEALLASVAACSGMDVVSILRKKQQDLTSYRIEVAIERDPPGEWPRPIKKMTVRHIVAGNGLDEAAVARSIQLTDEKYCTVISTLRSAPIVESTYSIE